MDHDERREGGGQAEAEVPEQDVLIVTLDERHQRPELEHENDQPGTRTETEGGNPDETSCGGVRDFTGDPQENETADVGEEERALEPRLEAYMRLYFGPLPPSRGVHRGPRTSVALQSTQFGALMRSPPSVASYTPAGHMWA